MEVRTALVGMQGRIDSLDLKMFVTAVLIQRETGGNLSEVLGNIGTLMRERAAMKADIETLTAESKMSARILALLPLGRIHPDQRDQPRVHGADAGAVRPGIVVFVLARRYR